MHFKSNGNKDRVFSFLRIAVDESEGGICMNIYFLSFSFSIRKLNLKSKWRSSSLAKRWINMLSEWKQFFISSRNAKAMWSKRGHLQWPVSVLMAERSRVPKASSRFLTLPTLKPSTQHFWFFNTEQIFHFVSTLISQQYMCFWMDVFVYSARKHIRKIFAFMCLRMSKCSFLFERISFNPTAFCLYP